MTHFYFEFSGYPIFLDDKFNDQLPFPEAVDRPLTPLVENTDGLIGLTSQYVECGTHKYELDYGVTKSQGLSIFSLFVERGAWSKQLYQPDMNHRPLEFMSFTERTPKDGQPNAYNPPLFESLCSDDQCLHFTEVTDISLFFYEVTKSPSDLETAMEKGHVVPLYTLSRVNCFDPHVVTYETHKPVSVKGTMMDLYATTLTYETFERVCNLFSIELPPPPPLKQGETSPTVSVALLSRFVAHFRGYHLGSHECFDRFLKDFKLEYIFKVDFDADLCTQVFQFGVLLRRLVKLRCGSPEGQHRLALCTFVASGFFDPSNIAPLPPVSMEDCTRKFWSDDVKFKDFQIFSDLGLKILPCSFDGFTLDDARREILKQFGTQKTAAQETNVEERFEAYIKRAVHFIQEQLCGKNVPLNFPFNHSWKLHCKDKKFSEGCLAVHNAGSAFLTQDPRVAEYFKGNGKQELEAQIATIGNHMIKPQNSMMLKDEIKETSKRVVFFYFCLKAALLNSPTAMENIEKFFSLMRAENQGPTCVPMAAFQTMEYVQDVIIPILRDVTEIYQKKLSYEIRLLNWIRTSIPSDYHGNMTSLAVNYDKIDFDMKNDPLWKIYARGLPQEKGGKLPLIAMNNSKMACGKYANVFKKIGTAVFLTLFNNIIDTIVSHGFDPMLPSREDDPTFNAYAHLYL